MIVARIAARLRELKDARDLMVYRLRGRRPWSRGYQQHKMRSIQQAINGGAFRAESLPHGFGYRLDDRIVEYPWFFSRVPAGPGKLLDGGSVLNYDFALSHPKLQEKQIFISTLAPEAWNACGKGVSYVFGDLRETCFRDGYFDWIASLSTVEHIGLDNTMLYTSDITKNENKPKSFLDAVREFRRVLKPGGVLYLSVPFGRYHNHGWFQVFDGQLVDELIACFAPAAVAEQHFRYEPDGWCTSSRSASKDATYFDILKQPEYDSDYAAASRAVVCLELVK